MGDSNTLGQSNNDNVISNQRKNTITNDNHDINIKVIDWTKDIKSSNDDIIIKLKIKNNSRSPIKYDDFISGKYYIYLININNLKNVSNLILKGTFSDYNCSLDNFGEVKEDEEKTLILRSGKSIYPNNKEQIPNIYYAFRNSSDLKLITAIISNKDEDNYSFYASNTFDVAINFDNRFKERMTWQIDSINGFYKKDEYVKDYETEYIPTLKIYNAKNKLIATFNFSLGVGGLCNQPDLSKINIFQFPDSDMNNLDENIACYTYKDKKPQIIKINNYKETRFAGFTIRIFRNELLNGGKQRTLAFVKFDNSSDKFTYNPLFWNMISFSNMPKNILKQYNIKSEDNMVVIIANDISNEDLDTLVKILPTAKLSYK